MQFKKKQNVETVADLIKILKKCKPSDAVYIDYDYPSAPGDYDDEQKPIVQVEYVEDELYLSTYTD